MHTHFSTAAPIQIRSRLGAKRLRRAQFLASTALALAFAGGCYASLNADLGGFLREPLLQQAQRQPIENPAALVAEMPAEVATNSIIAEPATPEIPAISYPLVTTLTIAAGDNFVSLLGKSGVSAANAHDILEAMGKKFNAKNLRAGNQVEMTLDKKEGDATPKVIALSMPISTLSELQIKRVENGTYTVTQIDEQVVKKMARASGKIDSSLYETIVGSGMPAGMVSELIKAFSYDVDFQRDIQPGNSVDVVFERTQTEGGKVVGHGNIIYASLSTKGRELRIYRYADKDGNGDYYTAKGESVRKALLRTPINGARISSGFGMRNHPILGYSKMHKGVDFAAATGTPVYAAGDGTVNFVGRKGGYGNYVQIKHNNTYASAYGHLSRFATGIAPGKKVKQGQIIAYVGSTGASTGPHLHYEILMAGNQVNPANVKFKTGNVLVGKELASFKRTLESLHAQLDAMPKNGGKLAMLDEKFAALSSVQ